MFASTHEYTRAHWESTVPQKTQNRKSQSTTELEDLNLKFETLLSAFCLVASMHKSSTLMNRLLKSIYLVLIVFNLLSQSHKTSIDIDSTHGEREWSLTSSLLSLSWSSSQSSSSLSSSLSCLIGPRLLHCNHLNISSSSSLLSSRQSASQSSLLSLWTSSLTLTLISQKVCWNYLPDHLLRS